jgi:hypothetical protein
VRHNLYYHDYEKGWSYLTREGEKLYQQNKAECDLIKEKRFAPKLQAWAESAVGDLLA